MYHETETAQAADGRVEMMRQWVDVDNRLTVLREQQSDLESELKSCQLKKQELARAIVDTVEPSQKISLGGINLTSGGF